MAEDAVTENENAEDQESEEIEDEELESEDGDSDTEEQEQEAPKPALNKDGKPVSQDDWIKTRRQTKEANKEAAKFRKLSEQLEQQLKTLQEKGSETTEDESESIRNEAYAKGQSEADIRFKRPLINREAISALKEAGFKGNDPQKYMARLLDYESVEVDFDDKGEAIFSGIDDFVDDLQESFPELFKTEEEEKPRPRPRAVDAGDKERAAQKAKPMNELMLEYARAGRVS